MTPGLSVVEIVVLGTVGLASIVAIVAALATRLDRRDVGRGERPLAKRDVVIGTGPTSSSSLGELDLDPDRGETAEPEPLSFDSSGGTIEIVDDEEGDDR